MNEDKLLELLDLAVEQYAPPPGKQAVVMQKIVGRRETAKTAQRETDRLFQKQFALFSALMQGLGKAERTE